MIAGQLYQFSVARGFNNTVVSADMENNYSEVEIKGVELWSPWFCFSSSFCSLFPHQAFSCNNILNVTQHETLPDNVIILRLDFNNFNLQKSCFVCYFGRRV